MYFIDLIQGQMETKPGGSRTCIEASRMQGEKTWKKTVSFEGEFKLVTTQQCLFVMEEWSDVASRKV